MQKWGISVPEDVSFPQEEEKILDYWKEKQCFKKSLEKSANNPRYTFYDGPPFATGLPHYGNILPGTVKDIVTRWAHQTGHHVERRFGWDCHGLPIEFEIEKILKIKTKDEVLKYGIANYNKACRGIVMRYSKEWETIIGRTGRWIDFENDYKTMNLSYMESVWWVFKQLYEKKLVYRGVKVMPYSTGCTTPLSNFEANMNYKETSDPSITISFPLEEDPSVAFIAWTTTPWTLPSNLGLCINSDFTYVKIKDKATGSLWIMAECRLGHMYDLKKDAKNQYEILQKFQGKELEGKHYVPLFKYFSERRQQGAFRVVTDSYVTSDTGTGIVHLAPGFGEDDYRVCLKTGIVSKGTDVVCPLDSDGCFLPEVTDFAGVYIKDADNPICTALKESKRLLSKKAEVHSYPYCWRSQTPLIYRCIASWFVEVEKIKEKLIASSKDSYWVPEFVQTKRFNNWLEDAKDWCVSRSRYWGTPLPIWHSEDWNEVVVVGSVAELEQLSGKKFTDIHRESVDDVTIPSKTPGNPPLRRVEDVFDCWFESGSMPYAQVHYPFENKEKFPSVFPADFIAEGLDQTRGWFYTLLVLSTALFEKPPFKNVIVNGLILAADGKKMSKSLKNYPDPMEVINDHSADALRLYLINSPVVRAEPFKFKKEGVKDVVKDVLLPLWNTHKFFLQNYERFIHDGSQFNRHVTSLNTMDRWIMACSHHLIEFVQKEMRYYRLYTVVPQLLKFLDNLTNWYVRMNRKRLKGDGDDAAAALATLYNTLMISVHLLAPFIPFITENIYQRLALLLPEDERQESIHHCMIPVANSELVDEVIERQVDHMQQVVELGRLLRDRNGIAVKMPVANVMVLHSTNAEFLKDIESLKGYIQEELNCMSLETSMDEERYLTLKAEANLSVLGKRLKGKAKDMLELVRAMTHEQVRNFNRTGSATFSNGVTLTTEEIKVIRNFKQTEEMANYDTQGDGDLLIMMDKRTDEKLIHLGVAREFVNRVQKLRKKAGLQPLDKINVYYEILDADDVLSAALKAEAQFITDNIRVPWQEISAQSSSPYLEADVITKEMNQIREKRISLVFTKYSAA